MCSAAVMDGFWLPKAVREQICPRVASWQELCFAHGQPCGSECEGGAARAVAARWPVFGQEDWKAVIDGLADARRRAPQGKEFWARLQAALQVISQGWTTAPETLHTQAVKAISCYTGYSEAMVRSLIRAPALWDLGQMAAAFSASPTGAAALGWQPLPGLPGRVRFTPSGGLAYRFMLGATRSELFGARRAPSLVLGYGAGNVPRTALIIVFLALATALAGGLPPVVLARNSRREPLFTPLVLSALEQIDEALVSTVAVMVWDYNHTDLQETLLSQADLVIAAAGDDTIRRLEEQVGRVDRTRVERSSGRRGTRRPRFHAHGHEVSFSVIGREVLSRESAYNPPGRAPA